jgi:ketosteroid isomerase-like protein
MSQEDVAALRAGFAAMAEGGFEALLPFIHPDFEVTIPPDLSLEPDTYRGPSGMRRYFESFYEAVDEVRFEPEDFIEVGECIVVPMKVTVRGRGSGAEAAQSLVQVWELRDGLAYRAEVHATLERAMAAARGD